eukprot:s1948_g20.t1
MTLWAMRLKRGLQGTHFLLGSACWAHPKYGRMNIARTELFESLDLKVCVDLIKGFKGFLKARRRNRFCLELFLTQWSSDQSFNVASIPKLPMLVRDLCCQISMLKRCLLLLVQVDDGPSVLLLERSMLPLRSLHLVLQHLLPRAPIGSLSGAGVICGMLGHGKLRIGQRFRSRESQSLGEFLGCGCLRVYMNRGLYKFCCCLCRAFNCCWMYTDKDFPPEQASLGDVKGDSAGDEGRQFAGKVTWVRGGKFPVTKDEKGRKRHMQLFSSEIDSRDICQGALGDCWLLAAIACLAEHDGAIQAVFRTKEVNPRGKYVLRLYDGAKERVWGFKDINRD